MTNSLKVPYVYGQQRTVTWKNVEWKDGQRVVTSSGAANVDISIDMDKLFATLGRKAARAKGKKAVMGGGIIVARRRA